MIAFCFVFWFCVKLTVELTFNVPYLIDEMAFLRGFEVLQKKESCFSNQVDLDVVKCQKSCHVIKYCRY